MSAVIAHWSDLHSGETALNMERTANLARQLRARHDAGEEIALAISGDCTHDGSASEWAALARALSPLLGHVPIFMVPGNHDAGALGITYDDERARRTSREIGLMAPHERFAHGVRVWHWGGYKILGLDSTRGNDDDWFPPLARGELGQEQLVALELELQEEVPTLVILHHHPLWSEWAHALEDCEALLALLDRREHVTHVLYGHKHREESATRCAHKAVYLGAGKTPEAKDGRLRQREIELDTGEVRLVEYGTYQVKTLP